MACHYWPEFEPWCIPVFCFFYLSWVVSQKLWEITSDHKKQPFIYLYKIWNQLNFYFSCFYSGGPLCTCATKNLWPKPTHLHSQQVLYLSLELFFSFVFCCAFCNEQQEEQNVFVVKTIRTEGYDCGWVKPDTPK